MAEPARKTPTREHRTPERRHEASGESVLLRWVEGPDGDVELLELPLTPELFLDPQVGDTMVQGQRHSATGREIANLLEHHFRPQPDVLVTYDLKHWLIPGQPAPAPDVSVIRGVRERDLDRSSFDVAEEGVSPCLMIEVVSPLDSRIREVDLDKKVRLYQQARIPEYIIVDSLRGKGARRRYHLLGYRLGSAGRYRPIKPDSEGRVLSETTGLWFQISPEGDRVLVLEHPTGRRLLNLDEEGELRKAAEERAEREAEARKEAEAEIARLRSELERLRGN
ncbi:MAG TPA: Uma2 family endonuclease [Thermoanaerobaculia bacterium]